MELILPYSLVLGALIGVAIGRPREWGVASSAFAGMFGPIGWVIVYLNDGRDRCESCLQRMPTRASVCGSCGRNVTQSAKLRQQEQLRIADQQMAITDAEAERQRIETAAAVGRVARSVGGGIARVLRAVGITIGKRPPSGPR